MHVCVDQSGNNPCFAKVGYLVAGEAVVCADGGNYSVFYGKRGKQPFSGAWVEEMGIVKDMDHTISKFLMKAASRAAPSLRSRT